MTAVQSQQAVSVNFTSNLTISDDLTIVWDLVSLSLHIKHNSTQ